jgi:general secretion pathway protein E
MPDGHASVAISTIEAVLARRGLLSGPPLERARRLTAESGERIDRIAAKLGLVSDADLAGAYAELLDTQVLTAAGFPVEPVCADRLRRPFLRHARVIPISEDDATLTVAMADPLDDVAVRALAFATEKTVVRRVALPTDVEAAYERLYRDAAGQGTALPDLVDRADEDRDADLERLKDLASEAPVIRMVNALIVRAVEMRASDIHIESADSSLRVRYRIDGLLHDMEPPPLRLKSAIISRVKIMARLNIAERRLPQDGRIRQAVRGNEIDFRVSIIPTIHGESVVLRILDRGALALNFDEIGFDREWLDAWLDLIRHTDGIVLVTGPTSSGKTTTLYTSLATLNAGTQKILTVEDPVEYVIDGISQVQVAEQIGMTFATALRSFLRHNPNIMMIGEIRDPETAQIAIQMSLSGHLVLSTVHTNNAASAMTRLLDMGIEDYLLTSTIRGVLAQRLVRKLCVHCREPFTPPADLPQSIGWPQVRLPEGAMLYRAIGCPRCDGLGFRGRTMILELLVVTDAIRSLVLRHAEARELLAEAVRGGMQTMAQNGLKKALAGITTIEEVARVIRDI